MTTQKSHEVANNGCLLVICIMVMLVAPTVQSATVPSTGNHGPAASVFDRALLADTNHVEIRSVWSQVWSNASTSNIQSWVASLSTTFPSRVWTSSGTPSSNLMSAWAWANNTLEAITGGTLVFRQITPYKSLVAVKNATGIGMHKRGAVIVSGVIDTEVDCPGANDVGASVAAVLETARLLNNLTLYCDVYYILNSAGRRDSSQDLGSHAIVQWLDEQQIPVVFALTFDRLLFNRVTYVHGTKIFVRSLSSSQYYESEWITDLMVMLSETYGTARFQYTQDHAFGMNSLAGEMWAVGIPAVHVTQGYWPDGISGSIVDTFDYAYFQYDKAREAVACISCVVAYVGSLGSGAAPSFRNDIVLAAGIGVSQRHQMTYTSYINVTATWSGNQTVRGQIRKAGTTTDLYSRSGTGGLLKMKYLCTQLDEYEIVLVNMGTTSANITVETTFIMDCDGDTLSDLYEFSRGTDPYNKDTDGDFLTDSFELWYGSDPTSSDSDSDGASDYDEYSSGSSLVDSDSDNDGLEDGFEMELGTSPVLSDTDGDGLSDYDEHYAYFTSPLDKDTDRDGLEDGFEIQAGLSPLAPDSDGDSLNDLFEVLNGLNPLARDTDSDGWSDAYEVEYCLLPNSADTDNDGIADSIDWDPRNHWVNQMAPVGLLVILSLIAVFGFLKHRRYLLTELGQETAVTE
ncbi:MAG: M28 family peptidase [Candidatus Thorarchaeota archaeon]|nr:M28 family peptidase [Candidatus Thorarchaeota archaeon]